MRSINAINTYKAPIVNTEMAQQLIKQQPAKGLGVYSGQMKPFASLLAALLAFTFMPAVAESTVEEKAEPSADLGVRDQQVREALVGTSKAQNFSLYKLNYAILNDEDLLLQYSFKYRIIGEFYLAYTNLILWDIYEEGMPAEDNNFMPEAFYRFMINNKWLTSVDAGWFHRSNGKQGPTSRAWDRWQVRLNKEFQHKYVNILWATTVYTDIQKSSNNQDINDYSGPWDTLVTFRNLLGNSRRQLDLTFKLVSGYEGYQFDTGQKVLGLQYRMPYSAFRPTIFLQYFNGYGEVIKHYNVQSESVRAGFSFHY